MVVRVREDIPPLREKAVYPLRPPLEVLSPVPLRMRVVRGKLSPVAEPADVDEVRGRLFHAGHPGVVDQGEGDAVLVQQFWQVGAEPAPVAHLDGVARSLR